MENSSLDNVGIELVPRSQNRGDEHDYLISSVFEDSSELETAQESRGQSCLTSGISANINSRQLQGETVGQSPPLRLGVRDRGKSPVAETEGAGAVTSNRDSQAVQSDDSSVYLSASLDDVDAVPIAGTCSPKQHRSPKADDAVKGQNSTTECSVTINFRLTEDQFCCSSRESSLHLQLDVANFEGTRNRSAFPPQVGCQQKARKPPSDAGLSVTARPVTSGGGVVGLHPPSRSAEMDDSDDFQGTSTLEEAETPEYSPTDSESSETSDEADAKESETKRSASHSDVECHFSTPPTEGSDVIGSEGVVNEKICANHLEATSDGHQSEINEIHSFKENLINLDTEEVEKRKQSTKEDLDANSLFSGASLDSEDNSKTSVVCKTVSGSTDPDNNCVHKVCESHLSATKKDLNEECTEAKMKPKDHEKKVLQSKEMNCKEEDNVRISLNLHISLDKGSVSSESRSESFGDERVLSTEILSDSDEQVIRFHGKDDSNITEGGNIVAKALGDPPQAQLIETPLDGQTQGQGDNSHSDVTQTGGTVDPLKTPSTGEVSEGKKRKRTTSDGEETKLKFPRTLEHVSEVPRGIFESILYKLYNRMNQRSPRAWRDISRGPCVKQLVKEFSKEAMECPKFPKSQSVPVQKTKEDIPKSKLFQSSSDMDDSSKRKSIQEQKSPGETRKSLLSDTSSDTDDRPFESRLESSTDDEQLLSEDVPIRSSTPSQEVVVMEIRDELQKPDCSRRKVLQLIKKFGGKGSFKKQKKIVDKVVKKDEVSEVQLPTELVDEGKATKDVTTDDNSKSETLCEKDATCSNKGSFPWLTNVSVKNLVSIFSEISKSPVLSRRSASRSSKNGSVWQSKDVLSKGSRTMETQTSGSEAIGSCSNVLLLVQPEYNGGSMLSGRFERKRSTLSVCLPANEPGDSEGGQRAADSARACASATGLLLVSTAEPVRVRALCSPDDNRTALSHLAQLLHLPAHDRRARSAARDSSLVRQMVAQWDRSAST